MSERSAQRVGAPQGPMLLMGPFGLSEGMSRDAAAKMDRCLPGSVAQCALGAVALPPEYLLRLSALARVIDRAARAVVGAYSKDARIRNIYRLSPAMHRILELAKGAPYRVGLIRPDLVHDREGRPHVCELGARYPLNGWLLSALAQQAFSDSWTRAGLQEQSLLPRFLADLQALHSPGTTLALVHAKEPGREVFGVLDELSQRGVRCIDVAPSDLHLQDGRLRASNGSASLLVDRCVFEMDRTELSDIPEDVLTHVMAHDLCLNDPRTLVLVHDKRILAVFWQSEIMQDLLGEQDYRLLREHLIASWTADDDVAKTRLLARPGRIIAKRNSGGRGIGVQVRTEDNSAWRRFVRGARGEYMYQQYITQCQYRDLRTQTPVHLVGMMLCRDGISYGAGLFRGSNEAVINIHQGRGQLLPAVVATGLPA